MSVTTGRAPSARRDITRQVAKEYLAQLDTPRSLSVWLLFASGEHHQLLSLDSPFENWGHFGGPDYVRRSHQATRLFAKSDFLNLGIDREKAALDSGRECELKNAETNRRLRGLRAGRIIDHEFDQTLRLAARNVARVLGSFDSALKEMSDYGWTPGRTSAVNSRHLSHIEKYQANLDVTSSALHLAECLVMSSGLWCKTFGLADGPSGESLPFRIVDHNTAMTVPKNAKTDRLICYEPHINIRLQRSVGAWMAGRIRRKTGIDLSDQSPNQVSARIGSRSGQLSTIDLSCASDTLATELVRELLPDEWWYFLESLRCRYTQWPDGRCRNEKFSSMGNGFTFELETLVFYSLVTAVIPPDEVSDVLVYGDDIVVPTVYYRKVVEALDKAGFSVNTRKSFSTGYFRESCGRDYYAGVDVTAPRIEVRLDSWQAVVKFHNRVFETLIDTYPSRDWWLLLRRWRNRVNNTLVGLRGRVPLGPKGLGDGHFFANFDEVCPPTHKWGWEGYYFDTWLPRDIIQSISCVNRGGPRALQANEYAVLSAALGPRAPLSISRSKVHSSTTFVRSRLFSKEWPSVVYLA